MGPRVPARAQRGKVDSRAHPAAASDASGHDVRRVAGDVTSEEPAGDPDAEYLVEPGSGELASLA